MKCPTFSFCIRSKGLALLLIALNFSGVGSEKVVDRTGIFNKEFFLNRHLGKSKRKRFSCR